MSDFFFIVLAGSVAVAIIQQFFNHSRSSQRRVYWICTALGAVAAFGSIPDDLPKGIGLAGFFVGVMLVAAYAYTPYIKINGKIRSLGLQTPDPEDVLDEATVRQHDPAPDAYSGGLTAAKLWWILVPLMLISAVNTYAFVTGEGEWWVAAIGMAFLVFLALTTGLGDASWGYPIARGQRIQFVVLTIVTLGTFTAIYLIAYAIGKRRPVRSKHSLEYRAHPDLREKFSE
jgi:hypothetical protein